MINREKSAPYILSKNVVIFLSVLLFACSPDKKSPSNTDDTPQRIAQCIAEQSQCEFDLAGANAQVLFDVEKITAEQPFNMVVKYHGNDQLKSITGYLEGVDMYMGKIPLFFDLQAFAKDSDEIPIQSSDTIASMSKKLPEQFKQAAENKIEQNTVQKTKQLNRPRLSQVFQTEVLVGSCSSAQMTWRIWLTFTTEKNIKYTKMFTVPSYRI